MSSFYTNECGCRCVWVCVCVGGCVCVCTKARGEVVAGMGSGVRLVVCGAARVVSREGVNLRDDLVGVAVFRSCE